MTLMQERSSHLPHRLVCLLLQSEYSALIPHRCANVDTTIISLSAKIIFIHYLQLIIIEFDPINHGFCLAILCHTLLHKIDSSMPSMASSLPILSHPPPPPVLLVLPPSSLPIYQPIHIHSPPPYFSAIHCQVFVTGAFIARGRSWNWGSTCASVRIVTGNSGYRDLETGEVKFGKWRNLETGEVDSGKWRNRKTVKVVTGEVMT